MSTVDGNKLVPGNASAVAVTDWDRDGDLDLIVGVISGNVSFIPNEGTKTVPKFGKGKPLMAGGKPITANDGGPCIADWDGDGAADLILGGGEGGVRWFRAKRSGSGSPVLEAGKILVRSQPYSPNAPDDRPMMRAKPEVVDWNRDGKPDLLVGDFYSRTVYPPTAKPEEQAKLRAQLGAAQIRMNGRVRLADQAARKAAGIAPNSAITFLRRRAYDKAYNQVLTGDAEFRKAADQVNSLRIKVVQPVYVNGGYVWVYLRR